MISIQLYKRRKKEKTSSPRSYNVRQITMKQISISDFATVEKWLHMKIVAGSRNHENNSKAQTTTTQQNIKFGKDSGKYLKSNYFGLLFFFNRLPNFRNNGFFFL